MAKQPKRGKLPKVQKSVARVNEKALARIREAVSRALRGERGSKAADELPAGGA